MIKAAIRNPGNISNEYHLRATQKCMPGEACRTEKQTNNSHSADAAHFHSLMDALTPKHCAYEEGDTTPDDDVDTRMDNDSATADALPTILTALTLENVKGNGWPAKVGHSQANINGMPLATEHVFEGDNDHFQQTFSSVSTQRQFILFPNGIHHLHNLSIHFQLNANTVKASFQDVPASQHRALLARKTSLKAALKTEFGCDTEIELHLTSEESHAGL